MPEDRAKVESGVFQKLAAMLIVLVGFQMVTFAFVFHIWMTRMGVAAQNAKPAVNLLITAGLALMATPLVSRIYGRVRGVSA